MKNITRLTWIVTAKSPYGQTRNIEVRAESIQQAFAWAKQFLKAELPDHIVNGFTFEAKIKK